ncbi:single-stranded DNA-binding protein 3-like [Hypomesus transpacificus]|uniref:single-stranded DNA-binding protein 3-like n=1 Tax=Hypomesus transpacificus TaxID=137520 RepID=UPI001F0770BF|nr:single-stranded DNA-binding protein 3-like [Hypomesus transpacificus]
MYAKGKGAVVPSDSQAREKLALYVYEYLLHVGAQKSAQTFLSEIRWEKNITLGEPPGFLHSWWCVFWDLYCAAPDRRETCEHSSEAKAFHDYVSDRPPSQWGIWMVGMGGTVFSWLPISILFTQGCVFVCLCVVLFWDFVCLCLQLCLCEAVHV